MTVVVNGAPTEVPANATVADVVAALGREPAGRGVAVAVDGEVVPRAAWEGTLVSEGARVEVLGAAQGG
jgi:sulfur carrier protein